MYILYIKRICKKQYTLLTTECKGELNSFKKGLFQINRRDLLVLKKKCHLLGKDERKMHVESFCEHVQDL